MNVMNTFAWDGNGGGILYYKEPLVWLLGVAVLCGLWWLVWGER
jgi:hypothetical protein